MLPRYSKKNYLGMGVIFIVALSLILASCAAPAATPTQKTKVIIYTAKENEEIAEYIPVAEKALPDLTLEVLRLSTGDLTARLLAEKERPLADVIWGVAATSMEIFKREGMLEPYAPKGVEDILPVFKSAEDPPYWVGVDGYVNAICYNTEKAKEFNLPMPETWEDLLDPAFKGHLVMPNPASSGTGYMYVSGILQAMGEEAGWDFLTKLDQNMGIYTKSGSKPCKMAAAGEYAVGLSFAFVGVRLKKDGAPIEVIVPKGTGWEVEANGLVKGTEVPEAAKRFLDWAISDEAMNLYAKYFGVMAKSGYKPPEGFPPDVVDRLWKIDFTWSSENRDRILEQWTAKFAAKAEE
jgi:iron(III) transport system substrate-binding protein